MLTRFEGGLTPIFVAVVFESETIRPSLIISHGAGADPCSAADLGTRLTATVSSRLFNLLSMAGRWGSLRLRGVDGMVKGCAVDSVVASVGILDVVS